MKTYRLPSGEFRTSHREPHDLPEKYADWVLVPEGLPEPAPIEDDVRAEFARRFAVLQNGYCDAEVKTWRKQEEQAKAWRASPTADVPLLQEYSAASGVPMADLVARIEAKVAAFEVASGRLLGALRAITTAPPSKLSDLRDDPRWPVQGVDHE